MSGTHVRNPAGPAPARSLNSIRRTSSIDTSWPDGQDGDLHMAGRCRDLYTGSTLTETKVEREDQMNAHLGWDRVIHTINSNRRVLDELVGCRGGGHLRKALDEKIHDERIAGTPLYLLLDDISGTSLVSGWVWSRWNENVGNNDQMSERFAMMENVCHGFATGSSALATDRGPDNHIPVLPLANPDDAMSWHEMPEYDGPAFRRARRIDVTIDDTTIYFDVGFQDTGTDPQDGRVAIHEYQVAGQANRQSGELQRIEATPRILPFPECPGAVANIQRLVGAELKDMRLKVIEQLPGTLGCTHLNDVLRGLAEVPVLAEILLARRR